MRVSNHCVKLLTQEGPTNRLVAQSRERRIASLQMHPALMTKEMVFVVHTLQYRESLC